MKALYYQNLVKTRSLSVIKMLDLYQTYMYSNGQWQSPLSFCFCFIFLNFYPNLLLTFNTHFTIIIFKERTVVPNGGFIKWQTKIS